MLEITDDDLSTISEDTLICDQEDNLSVVSDDEFRHPELNNQTIRNKFCQDCNLNFEAAAGYLAHCYDHHRDYFIGLEDAFERQEQLGYGLANTLDYNIVTQQAVNGIYRTFYAKFKNPKNLTLEEVLKHFESKVKLEGEKVLKETVFKLQLSVELRLSKQALENTVYCYPAFNTVMYSIMSTSMIQLCLENGLKDFQRRLDEFIELGSGWNFDTVTSFKFNIAKYHPLFVGQNIQLPAVLRHKRSLINVPSNDGECFKRAIRAHRQIDGNIGRGRKYKLESLDFYSSVGKDLNWTGINFPFQISQIKRFETQNPEISLCVISYEENRDFSWKPNNFIERSNIDETIDQVVGNTNTERVENLSGTQRKYYRLKKQQETIRENCLPIYACVEQRPIEIDLLMISDDSISHFVLIDNLKSFLKTKNSNSAHICRFCLQGLSGDLRKHFELCRDHKCQKTKLPAPGNNWLKFSNVSSTEFVPFAFIADFECLIVKQPDVEPDNFHVPSGFCWICIDHNGRKIGFNKFRASGPEENVIALFLRELLEMSQNLDDMVSQYELQAYSVMTNVSTIPLSDQCYFCTQTFSNQDIVVRHHSHLPPFQFIGLAHNQCNLKCQTTNVYPVFFHNLSGYDCHHLVQAFTVDNVAEIKIIAQTQEKFLAMIVNQKLRFVDSLLFFHSSLDKISKSMSIEQDFNLIREHFRNLNEEQIQLLLEKGIYPYSYMDSFEKFNETALPHKTLFFNDLTGEDISDEKYQRGQRTWDALEIVDMGMFHDIYMTIDTLILADALIKVRTTMYEGFGIDIFHYYTLPHFCFDAALKKTGVTLELLTDSTMHLWFESAIRGGLTSCGDLRAASANNPLCSEYDTQQPTSWIMYWDMNNLYSGPLKGQLPISNYEWINQPTLVNINRNPAQFLNNIQDNSSMGYFLEVDISFPSNIHDKLNSYPLAPYVRQVESTEVSRSQDILIDVLNSRSSLRFSRLIADLLPRKNYICHYRSLQHYIELGAVVDFVHKGVSYIQCDWLKPYIEFNTLKRQNSRSTLEKSFWKLANNCLYGKFIENKRNRQNIVLISSMRQAMLYNRKVSVNFFSIINENLVSLSLKKLVVHLDRPVPIGCAILDESKRLMSEFHYNYICEKYPDRFSLLATDTDSLIYKIFTDNVYDDCKLNKEFFDMSNYDLNNETFGTYHDNTNKLVIGKMKDEFANQVITHFVISKPKMYALKSFNPLNRVTRVIKKAKGVQRSAVKTQVTFEQYIDSILFPIQTFTNSRAIRSKKHRLSTINVRKKAINGLDLKRFVLDDCVNTLAFGHKDISLYQ